MRGALPDRGRAQTLSSTPSTAPTRANNDAAIPYDEPLSAQYTNVRGHDGVYKAWSCKKCGANAPRDRNSITTAYFVDSRSYWTHVRRCYDDKGITMEELDQYSTLRTITPSDVALLLDGKEPKDRQVVQVVRPKDTRRRGPSQPAYPAARDNSSLLYC